MLTYGFHEPEPSTLTLRAVDPAIEDAAAPVNVGRDTRTPVWTP